jgi:hypothetical protein
MTKVFDTYETGRKGEEIVEDWLKTSNNAVKVLMMPDKFPRFDMIAYYEDETIEVIQVKTTVQYSTPYFKLFEKVKNQLLNTYRSSENAILDPYSNIKYSIYFVGLRTPLNGAVLFSCDFKHIEGLLLSTGSKDPDGGNQFGIDTTNRAYLIHHPLQERHKNIAKSYIDGTNRNLSLDF